MAITANSTDARFALRIKPDFIADTLAELNADLATYVGLYVQVTDQGDKIYYVYDDRGTPVLQEGYEFDNYDAIALDELNFDVYTPTGVTNDVAMYVETKAIASNGRVIFYPTSDGTVSGTPLFSSILNVSAIPVENTTTGYDVPMASIKTATTSAVEVAVVRGKRQTVLLGAIIDTVSYSNNTGTLVQIKIMGVRA